MNGKWMLVGAMTGLVIFTEGLMLGQGLGGDWKAYWLAGGRLNAGEPLYPGSLMMGDPYFYGYPPLLAVLMRPLALVPWEVVRPFVAAGLGAVVAGTFSLCDWSRRITWWGTICLMIIPFPFGFVVGNAELLCLGLIALGRPWSLALAANLKLLPGLVALVYIARREWGKLAEFVVWAVGLFLVGALVEPRGTLAFFDFSRLLARADGQWYVSDFSLWAVSPWLLVGVSVVLVVGLGLGRLGWKSAVLLVVVAAPRVLAYQFVVLEAALVRRQGR